MLKHNMIFTNGVASHPADVSATLGQLGAAGVAWLDFVAPTATELDEVKTSLQLHDIAIQDVLQDWQRPKIENYDTTQFIVLRPAQILDNRLHTVEFSLFVGSNFVVTTRHQDYPALDALSQRLDKDPSLAASPQHILHLILEVICHSYKPVLVFLRDAIDDVEEDILLGDEAAPHRVYELLRDIMKLQRSVHPLPDIINDIREETTGELNTQLRNIEDRAHRSAGQVDGYRDALTAGLQLHTALLGQRQNEQMARLSEATYDQGEQAKKISAWAAILFTPTVLAGIYGMNFRHMPGLTQWYGFTLALIAMLAFSVTLYIIFKRQNWL